ncbi:PREDICTED: CLAVATA3/ESR (CLE)-related protein 11-like [Camelina sativa]|uniref:CLAVATA3/ESR (CLE)-related protein 11-like n=1 Tax=Camelina sativa TaxID=90675 RepID=A0ABM0VVK5_CAMSA|nr:PREDICTED: CLAVATA3/ESR (CLE)-related protein 11-like [Camelina sativa]
MAMKKQPKPCSFLFHVSLLSALFVLLLISFALTASYKRKSGINGLGHKRVLASNFDFTPFLKNKDRTQRQSQSLTGKETGSWYNDEERIVPSGPNPLHH